MATKEIKLNYFSVERFLKAYAQLRRGTIFLPAKVPLPIKSRVALKIFIPVIEQEISVAGAVIKALDSEAADPKQKPSGMFVGLMGGPEKALKDLNHALSTNEDYRDLLDLPPPQAEQPPDPAPVEQPADIEPVSHAEDSDALSMEWIREAVAQEEATREKEAAAQIAAAPTTVKQELSEEERDRAKPTGEFIMNLTKAMLRSGYYEPDHPGSQGAKQGLFENFHKCLADSREIMITSQVTRQSSEILITGILDEPVNVRTLVGSGMAELFVPKLQDYFDRKSLVSFAIKKDIALDHFEGFVDIMSDPKADKGTGRKVGELLSNALVEKGVSQISVVFKDDLIALELNLPWRVEMAIQRLAKDLTVLPMFKSESDEAIRTMKLQIIQDILRPLKHPEFLKDLIINCYIIAQHIKSLKTEDIEKVIIEAFPLDSLLPTSQFIFDELHHLRTLKEKHQENATLEHRFSGVKRILKWVARRLVLEDVKGAQRFLEDLFFNQILTFEELPADVQYLVNTDKMAKDVCNHVRGYVNRFLQINSTEDAVILLKLFRRILPVLIEQSTWQIAQNLTRAVDKAAKTPDFLTPDSGLPANPLAFVFKDRGKEIAAAYDRVDNSHRTMIDDITDHLGMLGVEILSRALSDSEERSARKSAMEALIKKGSLARNWIQEVLDTPGQKWYLIRNALMLLGHVGQNKEDIERALKFMRHEHPRVRDEALNLIISLKAAGAEKLVIAALDDVDDKVRWRAMNGLSELAPISEGSIKTLLKRITADAPEEIEDAGKHYRKIAQLIQALGAIPHIPMHAEVEDAILDIAGGLVNQKKGLLKRFKKSNASDQSIVLSAAVTALGNIGTAKSELFLEKMAGSKSPQAEAAQKAANNIKLQALERLSNSPDDSAATSNT